MNLCEQEVNVPDEFSVMTPVVIDHQSDCHRLTVDLKKKRVFVTTSSAGMMSDTHTHTAVYHYITGCSCLEFCPNKEFRCFISVKKTYTKE